MAVRFTSRIKQWTAETEAKIDIAVFQLATDIDRVAKVNAPKASRALVNSAKIEKKANAHYSIRFGGGKVPYGRIQHEGGIIKPKNKPFLTWKDDNGNWHRAKSVTIKGTKYLERAGDDNARNIKRYLKGL